MNLIFIRFLKDGQEEARGMFRDVPEGAIKILWRDGREEIMALDQLPSHWQEQLRRWNSFGSRL